MRVPHFQESEKTLPERASLLNRLQPMGFVIGLSPEPVNSIGYKFSFVGLPGQKEAVEFAYGGKRKEEEAVDELRVREAWSERIRERNGPIEAR